MLTVSSQIDGTIVVDEMSFHYRIVGDPSAPPVVVLHGIMGHSREWEALVEFLSNDFRMVMIDQRGHGETDWAEEYTPALMADDLVAILGQLGLDRPRVIAHSMGGMAAMVAAARHPELFEQLVIVDISPDSVVGEAAEEIRAFVIRLGSASYASIDEACSEWAGNPLARPELLHHYVVHCLRSRPDRRLVWRFDGIGLGSFFEAVDPAELWWAVDRISCPALVVRGEESPVLSAATAEEMLRRLPDAYLVVIPDGGHDLGVEQPEAVAAAAARFFERTPGPPSRATFPAT